jgi:hypothetical protein
VNDIDREYYTRCRAMPFKRCHPPTVDMSREATNRRNSVVTTINCRKNMPLPQSEMELIMSQTAAAIEEFRLISAYHGMFQSLTMMISPCCCGNTWLTGRGSVRRQLRGQFSTPMLNIWLAPTYTME